MPEIKAGVLTTGKKWHIVLCAKPDSNLIEGKHLILECVDQLKPDQLTLGELTELRLIAFQVAEELATEPGRWRLDFNGPAAAIRGHFHAHIKLPSGQDKLARLAG